MGKKFFNKNAFQVGCVPPAVVAVGEGVSASVQCWDTPLWVWLGDSPQVWAWRPPTLQCGPGDPPRADPSTSPLGVGLEESPSRGQTPQLPHWVWAWRPARHAGIPTPLETCCKACWILPAMHAGIPPPHEQNHRHM